MHALDGAVKDGLKRLIEQREVTEGLAQATLQIAHSVWSGLPNGAKRKETTDDMAMEFLVTLAGHEITGQICTLSDLNREMRRWLARRNMPAESEIWEVVSETLLVMEKEGLVERPAQYRKASNHKSTPWYLPVHRGSRHDLAKTDGIIDLLPPFSVKNEGHRLISPTEARAAILFILDRMGGETPMSAILSILFKKIRIFGVVGVLDAPAATEGESGQTRKDLCEGREALADFHLMISMEGEQFAEQVWEAAGRIRRGTKETVEGRPILCCYLIPSHMGNTQITLSEFGPTSTVGDVVRDLKTVFLRFMPKTEGWQRQRKDDVESFFSAVFECAIRKIGCYCSENGYCRGFYDKWDQESAPGGVSS